MIVHKSNYVYFQDKACEQVDYDVQSSSESEGEGEGEGGSGGEGQSDDDEMTRHRAMAIAEKEKVNSQFQDMILNCVWYNIQGNVLYKKGKYEDAVECYSRGILLDPLSAALPANRALALMKLERLIFQKYCIQNVFTCNVRKCLCEPCAL